MRLIKFSIILILLLFGWTFAFADAFNFLDEPWTAIAPATTNTWNDLILTGTIPSGSTGVVLKVRNTNASDRAYGVRENGSSDNRIGTIFRQGHQYAFIGVDSNLDFELYHSNNSDITTWVVGYTLDGVNFITGSSAPAFAMTLTDTWTDLDITPYTNGDAIGSLWEIVNNSKWGLRKNGSTDNRVTGGVAANAHNWAIIGVDTNEICEANVGKTSTIFYLTGYITKGANFLTNATNYQTATTGSYQDLDITADSNGRAIGAFLEVIETASPFSDYALRTNGSTEDIFDNLGHKNFNLIKVDGDEILEQKIGNTDVDTYLFGWTTRGIKALTLDD